MTSNEPQRIGFLTYYPPGTEPPGSDKHFSDAELAAELHRLHSDATADRTGMYSTDGRSNYRNSPKQLIAVIERFGMAEHATGPQLSIDGLTAAFIAADNRLDIWSRYPLISPDEDEATDTWACQEVSAEFMGFARSHGWDARKIIGVADDPLADMHAWVEIRDGERTVAVDWTARQFHNLRVISADPDVLNADWPLQWEPETSPGVHPLMGSYTLHEETLCSPSGRSFPMEGMAGCSRCESVRLEAKATQTGNWFDALQTGMMVCPECGNKRCPRAAWHENACTGSNEPGQPGSNYPAFPIRPREAS